MTINYTGNRKFNTRLAEKTKSSGSTKLLNTWKALGIQ